MKQCLFIKGLISCVLLAAISFPGQAAEAESEQSHQQWLKEKFSQQHDQLIPVVAVADMFYACNKATKFEPIGYQVKELITKMDREQLANKLQQCLNGASLKSDLAIDYGLTGCFYEQLSDLPAEERKQKMALVKRAINALSFAEKQKSFTQCVTDQAIGYLK